VLANLEEEEEEEENLRLFFLGGRGKRCWDNKNK